MNLLSFFDDVTGTWNFWAEISEGLKSNQWDSLYFHKKVHKKTLDLLKVTQFPFFPLNQCCVKPEEAMPGSEHQKRAEKFANNIQWGEGGAGASLIIFITDCLQNIFLKGFLQVFFENGGLSLKEEYIGKFISLWALWCIYL